MIAPVSYLYAIARHNLFGIDRLLNRAFAAPTDLCYPTGATACEPEPTAPRAWIDFPRDGAVIPAGAPVNVLSHVYAPDGVAQVLLSVNGMAYRRSPPTATGDFSKSMHEWFPDREGDFILVLLCQFSIGQN